MHKFKTNDQNEKRQPTLGVSFEFGRNAIELILKINISIQDLIEYIKN